MGNETVVESKAVPVSVDDVSSEEVGRNEKHFTPEVVSVNSSKESVDDENAIIVTGADAAQHLLSMRDDGDPSFTFRSVFLASALSAFQAVMTQIYEVCRRPHDRSPQAILTRNS
jgi:hypothetical protein